MYNFFINLIIYANKSCYYIMRTHSFEERKVSNGIQKTRYKSHEMNLPSKTIAKTFHKAVFL